MLDLAATAVIVESLMMFVCQKADHNQGQV
jgi:hypothetical protein